MFAAHLIYYSTPEQKSQYFDVDFGKRECGIMGWGENYNYWEDGR